LQRPKYISEGLISAEAEDDMSGTRSFAQKDSSTSSEEDVDQIKIEIDDNGVTSIKTHSVVKNSGANFGNAVNADFALRILNLFYVRL
jgi:hypothetical protein